MIMGNYLIDAGLFLVDTILGLYILIVLLRFLFQSVGADFYNPISQFVVKASNPILAPLHRIIPTLKGIDFAAILLLIVLESLRISITAFSMIYVPELSGVLVLSIGKLVQLVVYVMVFTLFARAVLSWVSGSSHHFATRLIFSLTEPLIKKVRRVVPRTGALDFSPIVLFIFLMLVLKLLAQPLLDFGQSLI